LNFELYVTAFYS